MSISRRVSSLVLTSALAAVVAAPAATRAEPAPTTSSVSSTAASAGCGPIIIWYCAKA